MTDVNQFLQSMQATAEQAAKVPDLQAQIDRLERELNAKLDHITGLETNILGYKEHISNADQKISEVTRERDDALFRTLEADDKLASVRKALGLVDETLGKVAAEITPVVTPEPAPTPAAPVEHPDNQPGQPSAGFDEAGYRVDPVSQPERANEGGPTPWNNPPQSYADPVHFPTDAPTPTPEPVSYATKAAPFSIPEPTKYYTDSHITTHSWDLWERARQEYNRDHGLN